MFLLLERNILRHSKFILFLLIALPRILKINLTRNLSRQQPFQRHTNQKLCSLQQRQKLHTLQRKFFNKLIIFLINGLSQLIGGYRGVDEWLLVVVYLAEF